MELKGRGFGGDELRLPPSSLSYTTTTTSGHKEFPTELPFSTSPCPSPGAAPPTATTKTTTPTSSHLREATFRHGNGVSTAAPPDPIQILPDPIVASASRTSSATETTSPPLPLHGFAAAAAAATVVTATTTPRRTPANVHYRECLKNHAAAVGGHVVDGCGEFMSGGPAGDEAEEGEFRCSVCGCHRSFHRKEIEGETAATSAAAASSYHHHHHPYFYHHLATANGGRTRVFQSPPPPLLALPPPPSRPLYPTPMMSFGGRVGNDSGGGATTDSSSEEMDAHSPVAAGGEQHVHVVLPLVPPPPAPSVLSRKRFRTKFTAEQRERMAGFADAMGWRMQRKDDGALQQFCAEIGVSRQVFKVWMHNNKHISTARRPPQDQRQQHQQQPPTPP